MRLPIIGAIIFSTLVAVPAFANIQRTCNAQITMSWLGSSNGPPFPDQQLDSFSARRGCGSAVPNRCRERARSALATCFSTAVASPNTMPIECQSNGVRGYDVGRMDLAIKRVLCEEPAWRNRAYDVRLTMRTSGDNKCPGTFVAPEMVQVTTSSCPQGSF